MTISEGRELSSVKDETFYDDDESMSARSKEKKLKRRK